MTLPTKDAALAALEEARADYLAEARETAIQLSIQRYRITIDDVRRLCPPPPDIDPRVMGAVFAGKLWEIVGYRRSKRSTCHTRPIQIFVYVPLKAVGPTFRNLLRARRATFRETQRGAQ